MIPRTSATSSCRTAGWCSAISTRHRKRVASRFERKNRGEGVSQRARSRKTSPCPLTSIRWLRFAIPRMKNGETLYLRARSLIEMLPPAKRGFTASTVVRRDSSFDIEM